MCEIFVKADPHLYECRARSIRLHGAVTSIKLENLFWHALEEIAVRDGMTTSRLIAKLYDELVAYRGEIENFTSFLRVCCLRYMLLMMDGAIPADKQLPLSDVRAHPTLPSSPQSSLMSGNKGTNRMLMQSR